MIKPGPTPIMEIVLSNVSKVFAHDGGVHPAFSDINFDIAHGQFVCLIGPSGCGKTTLLRCIGGLDQPSSGSILMARTDRTRPRISMVFQEHALLPWLSLVDNVALGLRRSNTSITAARQQARTILMRVGLEEFAEHLPHQVSGGMRQRTSVARAFAVEPHVLLMDEPFVFVDYQTRLGLYGVLRHLLTQLTVTVVFVTHDIPEAVLLADRVIVLSAAPGRVIQSYDIDLPRPRDPVTLHSDPRFSAFVSRLHAHLPNSPCLGQDKDA